MKEIIKKIVFQLPFIKQIKEKEQQLSQQEQQLSQKEQQLSQKEQQLQLQKTELEINKFKIASFSKDIQFSYPNNIDHHPWEHPYLIPNNIRRFREYSNLVWDFALDYYQKNSHPLECAFVVNMAQNMYKWGKLAQKYGSHATLFPNIMDNSALNCPEWEEFDGEFSDLLNGEKFLTCYPNIKLQIPCNRILMNGSDLYSAYQKFCNGDFFPLLNLMAKSPQLRHEILLGYQGFYPYYQWAKSLTQFEVIYAASSPLAAYASGKPYCFFSVGGDLQFDCGRNDDLGKLMLLGVNAARFLTISNPHAIGHCRRLGLTNGVYLPYPMDDHDYCPGEGKIREQWNQIYGDGIYVLMTSRLDSKVKGQDENFLQMLIKVAQERPQVKFIFLMWGNSVKEFQEQMDNCQQKQQFICLEPVGKKRLIDYYRSCDIVLDQFVYGYYGATALEAAAIGKPVLIKLRREQYDPLYLGDVAPMINAHNLEDIYQSLLELIDDLELRHNQGQAVRQWLVRNHGEQKTVPLMLALLRLTADQIALPPDLKNPLYDSLSQEELDYHKSCRV